MIKIVSETGVDVRKALNLDPLDLFVCEGCGCEIPIPPEANNKIICAKCNKTMDRSHFSPLSRKQKLWVSEKGLELCLQQHSKPFSHCNCVEYYREAVRFRQAIFETYEKQGEIGLAQAVGMSVAFYAGLEEGALKLLGRRSRAMKQAFLRDNSFAEEEPNESFLWDWLDTMQIKAGVGRPARTDTLILFLDAVVLLFCPNHYIHLLRDALRLRSHEYKVQANRATAHREAWTKFWKAKRAVEVSCKRLWRAWFKKDPEQPPRDWWERVTCQQGLIG